MAAQRLTGRPRGPGLVGTAVALALALAGCGSATSSAAPATSSAAPATSSAAPATFSAHPATSSPAPATSSARPATSARSADGAIPAALIRESRPIGRGPAFAPPASGPVLGACRPGLGRRVGVHVEVFAANRVVLVAAGIGARPPLRRSEGRITAAACFGALATLEPTGVVLVAPGTRLTVADLFRSWGQPLSGERLASFHGHVRVYVNGRRRVGATAGVPLRAHAEIVLEVGPYVPPHSSYHFPPGS